jgi:hypothetical protein
MRQLTLTLIIIVSINNLNAQITINGVVTDRHGVVLPGAGIEELYTTHNTNVDINGKFSITVNDTSKIRVSCLAYRDIIFAASKFNGDTIRMKPIRQWLRRIEIPSGIGASRSSMSVGFYGDINGMPYGSTLSFNIPYSFKRFFYQTASASLKTDFQSNTDFNINLAQKRIISKPIYSLGAVFDFHYRDLSKNEYRIKINDYKIKASNYFFDFVTICGGVLYRNSKTENDGVYGVLGINKTLFRTKSSLSAELSFVDDNIEYSLSFTQDFPVKVRFLRKLELGIIYKNYVRYDELNFVLTYRFSL